MLDLTAPTTRAERRAAVAGWRAVPVRQRFAVVRSAKRGTRYADATVAAAAEALARVSQRPRGRHWWQRAAPRATACLWLVLALVMAALSVELFELGGSASVWGWVCAGIALAEVVMAGLVWDAMRDFRYILAVAPPES